MITNDLLEGLLNDGDLRSTGHNVEIIELIKTSQSFDKLFAFLFSDNQLIVMRAADAVEKITRSHPHYLKTHKKEIFELLERASDKELKWHLAQIIPRVELDDEETGKVWQILTAWAINPKESRIVRTNSIHALFNLLVQWPQLERDFQNTVTQVKKENIPSINARIKQLYKLRERRGKSQ